MTGTEFLAILSKEHPHNMKILMTAYTDAGAIIDAINKGHIYKYISKPYKKEELMEVIDDAFHVYQYRKQLHDDYNKYKEVFTHSNDPIFLVSKSGKVIDVNDAFVKLLATSRDELINKIHNIIEEDLLEKLEDKGTLENIEVHFKINKEKSIDCLISLKKVSIFGDKMISYQGTIKNISDYKSALRSSVRDIIEKQKEEKEKISHLLHESSAQNLAGIKFYLSMLSAGKNSTESNEMITTVQQSLDKTIEELRDACFKLMPSSLSFELEGPLNDLCRKVEEEHYIKCKTLIKNDLSPINKDLRIILFSIIQKIINYLQKTENINILVETTKHEVIVDIEGAKMNVNKHEINHLYTEVDSYNGVIKIDSIKQDRYKYTLSFPIEK